MIHLYSIWDGNDYWIVLKLRRRTQVLGFAYGHDSRNAKVTEFIENTCKFYDPKAEVREHIMEFKPLLQASKLRIHWKPGRNSLYAGKKKILFLNESQLLRYVLEKDPGVLNRHIRNGQHG